MTVFRRSNRGDDNYPSPTEHHHHILPRRKTPPHGRVTANRGSLNGFTPRIKAWEEQATSVKQFIRPFAYKKGMLIVFYIVPKKPV
jgi:hypothetical protein